MARTVRTENPRPYRKESKAARKATNRANRRFTNIALAKGTEAPARYVHTEGWLTH